MPMRPVTPFMMIPTVRTVIRVPFRVVHTGVTVRRYYRLYVASYMLCSGAGVDDGSREPVPNCATLASFPSAVMMIVATRNTPVTSANLFSNRPDTTSKL